MDISAKGGKVTKRLVIQGRVQGVYFRESMRRAALNLAVAGWVRNRLDGAVEAVVHGEAADIDSIVRWAQHGPELARVDQLAIEPAEGSYSYFEILRT